MQIEHSEGVDFVLEHLVNVPVAKRVRILRWLAGMAVNEGQSRELASQATELESAERRFQEFHFRFRQQMRKGGRP